MFGDQRTVLIARDSLIETSLVLGMSVTNACLLGSTDAMDATSGQLTYR